MPHVRKCSAIECDEYSDDVSTTALFRFPADSARCRTWVQNCGNRDLLLLPAKKLHQLRYLCAKHFEPQHFWDKFRRKLHRNAVPTIFNRKPLTAEEMASFDAVEYENVDSGQESSAKNGKPEKKPFIEGVFSIPEPSTMQSVLSPVSPLRKRIRRNDGYLDEEGDAEIVLLVLEEEKSSPCENPVKAVVQNKYNAFVKESSPSVSQRLETKAPLVVTSSREATVHNNKYNAFVKESSPSVSQRFETKTPLVVTSSREATAYSSSPSVSQRFETKTPLVVTSSREATAYSTLDQTGAENPCSQSPRLDKTPPQSRTTPCERELELIEKKYSYEIELIKMKKETEKLKQEALREKLLFYKEKRRQIANDN